MHPRALKWRPSNRFDTFYPVGSHPDRFKVVAGNLHIKEVFAGEGTSQRRYVITYNPEQAKMERINREKML